MAKIKSVTLTPEQQAALEKASRHGKSYSFRQRCLMVLLKSQSRTSKDVAQQVGCCEVVVNTWMKRYQQLGLDGLKTKAGRGRKQDAGASPSCKQTPTLPLCVRLCKAAVSASLSPKPNLSKS